MIDPKAVYFLQNTLDGLGYNPGPLDGILGKLTLSAVATLKEAAVKPDVLAFQQCLVQVGAWTTPFVAPTGRFGPITQASWDAVVQFSKGGDASCATPDAKPATAQIDASTPTVPSTVASEPAPTVPPAGAGQPVWHAVRASSFADPADVAAFRRCKAQGYSDKFCFRKGDNGVGEWGMDCTDETKNICALPPEDWQPHGPHPNGTPVQLRYNGRVYQGMIGDSMPHKANITNGRGIDLAPGFCKSLGLTIPVDAQVEWAWG